MFATLASANCAGNFNLTVPEGTPSSTAISTSDNFFATFATFVNTILEREPNVCESNPFLLAVNRQ